MNYLLDVSIMTYNNDNSVAIAVICTNLMKYTAKGINTSNMLVKLRVIQILSHYEKVKIKKIKYVYILMNRKAMH